MAEDSVTKVYNIKAGSKRKRASETPAEFIARIVRTAKHTFKNCSGDVPAAALIYGVEVSFMEDIISAHRPHLQPIITAARAVAATAERDDKMGAKKAAEDLRAAVRQGTVSAGDKRLKRHSWPVDEDQRYADVNAALLVSLVENEGDIAAVSECLNVKIPEILEMLEGDEELFVARELGLRVKAVRAESQLYDLADHGNAQAIKMTLTNLDGERWSERQQVDVRRVGFDVPPDKAEDVGSVLKVIKGDG